MKRVTLAAVLMLLCVVDAADARSFGANLARPANVGFGCEVLPTTDPFGARAFQPLTTPSCTYLGAGSGFGSRELMKTPFSGRVTRVRIRVGPRTGPMQIMVLRSTSTSVTTACCFYQGASRVFTPRTNAINTVRTNLRVRHTFRANIGETVDYIGISVLAPGIPIPANDTGVPGDTSGPAALAFFPRVAPGDERSDYNGVSGVTPLLNATVRRR